MQGVRSSELGDTDRSHEPGARPLLERGSVKRLSHEQSMYDVDIYVV
jgi:hypothetical protein